MAGLRQAYGDLDAAVDLLEQARVLYVPGFFPDVRPILTLRARVDIARGRLDLARDWAREHGPSPTDLSYLAECNHLTLVRLLIAEGRTGEAAARLDDLSVGAGHAGREGSVIEILMLRALAHGAGGRVEQAMPPLTRALERPYPPGTADSSWTRVRRWRGCSGRSSGADWRAISCPRFAISPRQPQQSAIRRTTN